MRMNLRRHWMFIGPMAIAGVLLVGFIGGEIVKALWNWLLPALFGWPQLTFWQALGLLALCRILVGGHGVGRSRSRRYSPEDRERFRRIVHERFASGHAPPPPGEPGYDQGTTRP